MRQNNIVYNTINERIRWCCAFFIILLTAFFFTQGFCATNAKAKPAPVKSNPATLIEYLAQERSFLTNTIKQAKTYVAPKNEKEFNDKTKQIEASLTIVDAKIESLNAFLDNQRKQGVDLNQKLKYLQQLPLSNNENIPERVGRTETLLAMNGKTLELITETIDLAQQLKVELLEETKKLKTWQEHFYLEQKLLTIKEKKDKLNEQLFTLYQSNISNEKKDQGEPNIKVEQQAALLINNQSLSLLHNSLDILKIQKRQ